MWIFSSVRHLLISFVAVVLLIAALVWVYLNIQASMQISAKNAQIQLSKQLPTKIQVGNYLQAQAKGALDADLKVEQTLNLPLTGKYLADLSFAVTTPIIVDIDYTTNIHIETVMPLETNTDLVYQNKLLPKFPLKMDIPIQLDVPFQLKRSYQVPIKILFDGSVYFQFDEAVDVPVNHQFRPVLNINDPITMRKISTFNATMINTERQSIADLNMDIDLPIKNIHP
ncbi:hypothetical protein [Acinetobacter sp. P8-3-8]|uniref:hypothetical protein n=1 Tax=Acinetobacter sp. P8-3-8 TaxID=1029823 RepID=UPI0002485D65|nr:hypothetical protein [Acinetobacter sp. P8-3-8]